jgi:hypothetical protein
MANTLPALPAEYARGLELIDAAHAEDTRTVRGPDGTTIPYELDYAQKMTPADARMQAPFSNLLVEPSTSGGESLTLHCAPSFTASKLDTDGRSLEAAIL